jgi:excisionase family DNA binding protein
MSVPSNPHTRSLSHSRSSTSRAPEAGSGPSTRDFVIGDPRSKGDSGMRDLGKGDLGKGNLGKGNLGKGNPVKGAEPKTAALFVRIPTEHARRLDRAAFELRVSKQSLVAELVERYVDPDSPASLMALGRGWGLSADGSPRGAAPESHFGLRGAAPAPAMSADEGGRRRVAVETLDPGELTIGRHSFRPRDTEVLKLAEVAELLQVDPDVVLDLASTGELPGRNLRGEWRFAREALLRWLGAGATDEREDAGRTADADARG